MRPTQRYSPMTLRSNTLRGGLLSTGVLWVGLLLAAPLAAQQTVVVPDVNVNVPPAQVVNNITVMSDSTQLANLTANLVALRLLIAQTKSEKWCRGAPPRWSGSGRGASSWRRCSWLGR